VTAPTQAPQAGQDAPHAGPGDDAAVQGRGPRRWARVADLVLVLALLGVVGVWALRFIDSTAYPVVVLQTAGPLVVVALILLTATTLLLRRWWVLLPVATALTVGIWSAVPAWTPSTTPDAEVDFTVLSANLYEGRANARQLMDAVTYHSVDVLVLTEVTPEALAAFEENGADSLFSSRAGSALPGIEGTMVLSRYPLSVRSQGSADAGANLQPEVDVTTPTGTVRLRAVHPPAPLNGRTDAWHAALTRLDGWATAQPADEPLVLAGDFNAATGHPVFRSLADGLVDAQSAAGLGWVRTWPFTGRRMPPYVEIDHLLTRGLTVVEAGQVAVNGADHAAVWASYAMPGATGRTSGR
jgi:endonuclease/exonuclease/phosphatase (EEP) superfamily protein YafD